MDERRRRLISWRSGYDIRDHMNRVFRCIVARRIRKQERAALMRDLPEHESDWIAGTMDRGPEDGRRPMFFDDPPPA